jgi:hypothetical protein
MSLKDKLALGESETETDRRKGAKKSGAKLEVDPLHAKMQAAALYKEQKQKMKMRGGPTKVVPESSLVGTILGKKDKEVFFSFEESVGLPAPSTLPKKH